MLRIYLFIFIFSKSEIICEPQSSAWVQVPRPASVAPRELPAVHLPWLLERPEDGPFPPPLRVPLMQTHKWPYSKMTANTWRNVVLLQSVTKSEASRPYLVQFWFLGRSLDQFHCLVILYPDPVTTPGPAERARAHLLPGPVVQEPCSGLVRRAPVGAERGQGPCRRVVPALREADSGLPGREPQREPVLLVLTAGARCPSAELQLFLLPGPGPGPGVCAWHSWLPVFSSHV